MKITEFDPQVGSTALNLVPRWNGTTLVDGVIQDDATNVGVGAAPVANQKLTVGGKTTTTNLQMTSGAGTNLVLQSDALGNGSWVSRRCRPCQAFRRTDGRRSRRPRRRAARWDAPKSPCTTAAAG